jgi:hypothetical protein
MSELLKIILKFKIKFIFLIMNGWIYINYIANKHILIYFFIMIQIKNLTYVLFVKVSGIVLIIN